MTQDMPIYGDDNDTEVGITNTGEVNETLNITSIMTQGRPIGGDDNDTEKDITNEGKILEKLNGKSNMTQNISIDGENGITEMAITNAGEIIEKHTYLKGNCILFLPNHRKNHDISQLKICPRQLSLRLAIENQILLIHH